MRMGSGKGRQRYVQLRSLHLSKEAAGLGRVQRRASQVSSCQIRRLKKPGLVSLERRRDSIEVYKITKGVDQATREPLSTKSRNARTRGQLL